MAVTHLAPPSSKALHILWNKGSTFTSDNLSALPNALFPLLLLLPTTTFPTCLDFLLCQAFRVAFDCVASLKPTVTCPAPSAAADPPLPSSPASEPCDSSFPCWSLPAPPPCQDRQEEQGRCNTDASLSSDPFSSSSGCNLCQTPPPPISPPGPPPRWAGTFESSFPSSSSHSPRCAQSQLDMSRSFPQHPTYNPEAATFIRGAEGWTRVGDWKGAEEAREEEEEERRGEEEKEIRRGEEEKEIRRGEEEKEKRRGEEEKEKRRGEEEEDERKGEGGTKRTMKGHDARPLPQSRNPSPWPAGTCLGHDGEEKKKGNVSPATGPGCDREDVAPSQSPPPPPRPRPRPRPLHALLTVKSLQAISVESSAFRRSKH
eukprot:759107-Hanusia_phi.AAC.1